MLLAPISQHADFSGVFGTVGGHQTALAGGAEILGGVEAEAAEIADAAGAAAAIFGAVRLRDIFDDDQFVALRDIEDRNSNPAETEHA